MSQRATVEITDANYGGFATGKVTVLELWAPWCAACGSLTPLCDGIGRDHAARVQLARCDIDANRRVASELHVRTVPMVVVFGPDGSEIGRSAGAFARRRLERLLEIALGKLTSPPGV